MLGRRRTPQIRHFDPFTVGQPFRPAVRRILAAHRSYHRTVADLHHGPLRDQLHAVGDQVDAAVVNGWQLARRGQTLLEARRPLDTARLRAQLAELDGPAPDAAHEELRDMTRRAVQAQLDSADHLDAAVQLVVRHLEVVEARLGEVCARTAVVVTRARAAHSWDPEQAAEQLVLVSLALHEVDLAGRLDASLPALPPQSGRA